MSKYKIIDVDGSQIGLDELADKYYSNPEDYFDKGFTPEQEANSELRKNIFLTRRQGVILQAFSKNVNEQSTSDNGAVTKL